MEDSEILQWLIGNNCIDWPAVRWAVIGGVARAAEVDDVLERMREGA
jgi:hypothetical protein